MDKLLKKKYEEYIKLKIRQQQILKQNGIQKNVVEQPDNKEQSQPTNNNTKTDNKKETNNNEVKKSPKAWKLVRDGILGGMSGDVLYVTSFNKDMYDMSGGKLLDTFVKFNKKSYMLVCYEGMKLENKNHQIVSYNLANSQFLNNWLKENEKDIPTEYGGKATPENNKDLFNNYFNKAASKWFRKVVSIDYAVKTYGHLFNYVVWVDADCYAIKTIPKQMVDLAFGTNHVIYHLSSKRRRNKQGIESGIIGFKKGLGYKFMDIVSQKFKSGEFRKYSRWDDGWVFREVVDEETVNNKKRDEKDKIKMLDVVGHVPDNQIVRSEVIPYGPFKPYLIHEKGKHNKLRGHKTKKRNFNAA